MGEISTITLLDGVTYDIKDAKSRMTILKYGTSTWAEFLAAYQTNTVIYCRASSNSNPATGSQTRLAFLAYVNNETSPTEVEFQYYRSVSTHSDSQQGDEVYVYKINSSGTWSVTKRNAFTKIATGTGLAKSYASGTLTLSSATQPIIFKLTTAEKFNEAVIADWSLSIEDLAGAAVTASDAKACLDTGAPAYVKFEYQDPDTGTSYDDTTCYLLRWNYDDTNSRYYLRVDWQEAIVPKDGVGIGYYEIQIYYSGSAFVLGYFDIADEHFPNSDLVDLSRVPYDNTNSGLTATDAQSAIDEVASAIDKSNAVFINFSCTGHTLDEEYEITDGWWTFDSITDADGNSLTYTDLFSAFQDGKNIFLNATSTIQNNPYYYKNIPMSGVDSTVTDPDTAYYISFDFVDGTSNDQSTWRVWAVIYNNTNPVIYRIDVDGSDADNIRYSNTSSGLTATDVQDAIDELASEKADASDYLPLSAGSTKPLTDWLYTEKNGEVRNVLKSTSWDYTSATSGASTYEYSGMFIRDKNANNMGTFETYVDGAGKVVSRLTARNKASGTEVVNQMALGVTATGERTVTVSAASAWRKALGMEYSVGDTVDLNGVTCAGYLTSSKTALRLFVPLDKPVGSDVSSVTLSNTGTWEVRHADGGYIVSSNTLQSIGTVSCGIKSVGVLIAVALSTASAFTNNAPVAGAAFSGVKLTFS